MPRIILASRSKARIEMLVKAVLPFESIPADIDEQAIAKGIQEADSIAMELARQKALAVSEKYPEALVIGSDQVLECEDSILSKANNKEEAEGKLKFLRGKKHRLISGIAAAQNGKIIWQDSDEAYLTMRNFDDAFLQRYLNVAGEVLTSCAGAYALEESGAWLFEEVKGDYFTILGMPLIKLLNYLQNEHGVSV